MIDGWSVKRFTECVISHSVKRANQINASEIKTIGNFPVIDQGQSFISGFTDDTHKLISSGFPYIIFGDHTRCFKYVDFPFVLGADGTKVLKPNEVFLDPKFFFYALLNLHLPSRGYNRHYKLLKEKDIYFPCKTEQRKIAALLSLVQHAIEQQERLIELTNELKKSLMHKLFTEGIYGELQKKTDIGPIPESWTLMKLGEVSNVTKLAGFEYTKYIKYVPEGEIVALRVLNLKDGRLDLSDVKRIYRSVSNSLPRSKLYAGDVLLSYVGTVGSVAVVNVDDKYHLAPNVAKLSTKDASKLMPQFLAYFLLSDGGRNQLFMSVSKTSQPVISMARIRSLSIGVPTIAEQMEICNTLALVDSKMDFGGRALTALEEVFRTLLHQLMTAQIRVNDLDLGALGLEIEALEKSEGVV